MQEELRAARDELMNKSTTDEAAMTSASEQLFNKLFPSLSSPEIRTSKPNNGHGISPAFHTPEETAAASSHVGAAAAASSFVGVAHSTPVGLMIRRSSSPAPQLEYSQIPYEVAADKGDDKDDYGPPEVEIVMPVDEEE